MADLASGELTPIPLEQVFGWAPPARGPEVGTGRKLVLKRGSTFAVLNGRGNVSPASAAELGLFFKDTRFLSFYELKLPGDVAAELCSHVSTHYISQIDFSIYNGFTLEDGAEAKFREKNFMHLQRRQVITDSFVDHIRLLNYLPHTVRLHLELWFAADFADLFEVRGMERDKRGQFYAPQVGSNQVRLTYKGVDEMYYRTNLIFSPNPKTLDGHHAQWELTLKPAEQVDLEIVVLPSQGHSLEHREISLPTTSFAEREREVDQSYQTWNQQCTQFSTSDEFFNLALTQGRADLRALILEEGERHIIAAGVPWYVAPFGRDALITAFQALLVRPDLARESLQFLAYYQGKKPDEFREEAPGKIMHEMRYGELARIGAIRHTPYYGTVDATPLFIVLLEEYWRWTADKDTVLALLPAAVKAAEWLVSTERWGGDPDGDGFIEYFGASGKAGLENQGWKDSIDGVPWPDHKLPDPPIALVEVQGYAVDAFRRLAALLHETGKDAGAARQWRQRADHLAARIEEHFWLPNLEYYALALDGNKKPLPTLTSNPGHLLFNKIIDAARAHCVEQRLMGSQFFSGWGIRTLASQQQAYNPLSYHNGTVWPHDNSMIAMGLSNYGMQSSALKIFDALFAAARSFAHMRLPELFCGIGQDEADFPVHYPVACLPQSWSSGSWFLLLRAILGIQPDAPRGTLQILQPCLPPWLKEVRLSNLHIGHTTLDLVFFRRGNRANVEVLAVEGDPLRVQIQI